MKQFVALTLALVLFGACSANKPSVKWYEGESTHKIVISNTAALEAQWEVWFSQFPAELEVATELSNATIEHIQANTYRIVPCEGAASDSIVVVYDSNPLKRHSWAPEGFTLRTVEGTCKLATEYEFLPVVAPDPSWSEANNLKNLVPVAYTDMIPALKSVTAVEGTTNLLGAPFVTTIVDENHPSGWYRIKVNGQVTFEAVDEDGLYYAYETWENIKRTTSDYVVENVIIEDWPDFSYRGAMIDVSRNFTTQDNLLTLIDIFAHYKLNVLHLHLTDDEGWRLAVDGIEELTSLGAVHALPVDGEELYALQPSYDGNADPTSSALSNGFYTKEQFIEILRYANVHHIKVIPEFDMPGHSRAAIKAMIAYEKRTGDSSMRLHDPEDASRYVSAQGYTDNVLCVANEGVYKFIEKIIDYTAELYREAGVELLSIHLGGDEVPHGAWTASPACAKFMAENNIASTRELRSYFITRVCDIVAERGLKLSGWEEIAGGITAETAAKLHKVLYSANCWNTVPSWGGDELPYTLANEGFKVVLSNVMNTYADEAYSPDKREIGHSWACYLDEKKSFALQPFDIYKSVLRPDGGYYDESTKVKLKHPENILGVQVQMFTETIRSFDDLTYDMFPKIVGAFERSWNATPNWQSVEEFNTAYNHFYSILVEREMPYYNAQGINFRLPTDIPL